MTTESKGYHPPEIWTPPAADDGRWSAINRETAGARFEATLPRGEHSLQLYSQGTPNGQKVTIALEELLAQGHSDAEYDAWLIDIGNGDQFSSGFVQVNPNSKIPALVDHSGPQPVRVFESGAILLHLADRFGALLPRSGPERTEALNWLFWLQGSAPFIGGGFGHFYAYAPVAQEYPINRYAMETKRLLDVMDQRLAQVPWLGGQDYTIADIAAWPWIGGLMDNRIYGAARFLGVEGYTNLRRWTDRIGARDAVQRGLIVNSKGDADRPGLTERHSAADIDRYLAG